MEKSNKNFPENKKLIEEIIINNLFVLGEHSNYNYGIMIVNARYYSKDLDEEKIFNNLIKIFKQSLEISEKIYNKNQIIVIANMQKMTFSNINSSFLKKMVNILQDTYPERLFRCFIKNPPFIFNYIYKIIRPFMDNRTTSKIKILSKNKKIFDKEIKDINVVPEINVHVKEKNNNLYL